MTLGPGYEEGSSPMHPIKPGEVEVAAIHPVESSGLRSNLVEPVDIVRISSGAADKRWNGAVQIEQRVPLDGGLGRPEMRPGKQAHAQVDGGRIQRVHG
jgi:hypothetical protein